MQAPYAHIASQHGFMRADFRPLTTDEGGRESPIGSDYRANWSIGRPDPQSVGGAPLTTDDGEAVRLGETAAVRLFPIWPEFWQDVRPGTELFAFEGPRLVGTAVVTHVVPPPASPESR